MATSFPFQQLGGLRPRIWLCAGAGYSREELKSAILKTGTAFVAEAVRTPQEICLALTGREAAQVLGPQTRQEVLRHLLSDARIHGSMPELKRLKRQSSFFSRLDRAIQSGRLAFAHEEEEEVLLLRLRERTGAIGLLQQEVRKLALYYEAWMKAAGRIDPPALMREATRVLGEGWPEGIHRPEKIYLYQVQKHEGLESAFWSLVSGFVPIVRPDQEHGDTERALEWNWERWHTIDDAADGLAGRLGRDWENQAVLFADTPETRRSLMRALARRGIPVADPRDPTRVRWDERFKTALFPLELVARRFERSQVIGYVRLFHPEQAGDWIRDLNSIGIRNGLRSYLSAERLRPLHSVLKGFQDRFGKRLTCEELSREHLGLLERGWVPGLSGEELASIHAVFKKIWDELQSDLKLIEQEGKRAPLLFWLERVHSRLNEIPPPVDALKPSKGIGLYRLQQAPGILEKPPGFKLWILGLGADWLDGQTVGDYWFSVRDREILGSEFNLRSSIQVREERLHAIKQWLNLSAQVTVLESLYDFDGGERESVLPVLREIGAPFDEMTVTQALECGAYEPRLASFDARLDAPHVQVHLPWPSTEGRFEISATALDQFSRCPFQALVSQRWRIEDIEEPGTDLWPYVKGNLLHKAVFLLMQSRNDAGAFSISTSDALEKAWGATRIEGLLQGDRLRSYVKARLLLALEKFTEKEREYVMRAGTRPLIMEEAEVRLEYDDLTIKGKPDRVDSHPGGLFVMDYKLSTSALPGGREILGKGYRLQLPFYALASQRIFRREVLGAQYVELSKLGPRSKGIFIKAYNGKDPGMLTATTANSGSLIDRAPAEVWSDAEEILVEHAKRYRDGRFDADPKDRNKECLGSCRSSDLCGFRRLGDETDA